MPSECGQSVRLCGRMSFPWHVATSELAKSPAQAGHAAGQSLELLTRKSQAGAFGDGAQRRGAWSIQKQGHLAEIVAGFEHGQAAATLSRLRGTPGQNVEFIGRVALVDHNVSGGVNLGKETL